MKTALVAGAAGFIGSHLCDFLISKGYSVIGLDNFVTGQQKNLKHLESNPQFSFYQCDITQKEELPQLNGPVHEIYNMASPASPIDFKRIPIFILQTSAQGQAHLLKIAQEKKSRILFASTSEVYGDPLVHPQVETYLGNVNPVGERGCYDEAKRFGEAISMAYRREFGVNTAIARIFNTYGTRMRPEDGRVIPNFFSQGLMKLGLTIYGSGQQTRSLCYVSDLVEGLYALMQSSVHDPVNIGNPQEMTILEIANTINKITGNTQPHRFMELPPDDPKQRCPNIDRAKSLLKWTPKVTLEDGLRKTFEYFRDNALLS